MAAPHGMAALGDELFIADHDNHRIVVLSLAAEGGVVRGPARTIGSRGSAPGLFEHPVGVCIGDVPTRSATPTPAADSGADRMLLVSEFTGRRVQALTLDGEPLCILAAPDPAHTNLRLLGVCCDARCVFAGDFDQDSVHCWNRDVISMPLANQLRDVRLANEAYFRDED